MEFKVEFSDHRGVIGRALQPARGFVHPTGGAGRGQRRAEQEMVDAQSQIAAGSRRRGNPTS